MCDCLPVLRDLLRVSLRPYHHPVHIVRRIHQIAGSHIVIPHDVHGGLQLLQNTADDRMGYDTGHVRLHGHHEDIHVPLTRIGLSFRNVVHDLCQPVSGRKSAVDAVGCKAVRIQFMKLVTQHPARLESLFRADLEDLVARGIHNYAGMIVICLHHMFDIALPAPRKVYGIVITYLALVPHVHQFVHHVDAQLITGPKQRLGRRVVGRTYRIETGLLQPLHPAVLIIVVSGSPQNPLVMVNAGAPELHRPAVHPQAVSAVHGKFAYAGSDHGGIKNRFSLQDRHHDRIERRGEFIPKFRLIDVDIFAKLQRGAAVNPHRIAVA